MLRLRYSRFLISLVIGLACVCQRGTASQEAARRPSVLMLFSSGSGTPSMFDTQRAFERALVKQLGGPVEFQSAYLDLSNESDLAFQQTMATLLARKYSTQPIDVVVVQRLEALAYLLRHRAALLTGVPVVFMEVYGDEAGRLQLPPDVTGVVTVRPMGTVPIALGLMPGTRRFVVVAGSATADRAYAAAVRQNLTATWPGLDVEMLDGKSIDEQAARLAHLPPNSLVLFPSYRSDSSGRSTIGTQVLEELSRAANTPIFGFQMNHLGYGIAGGDLVELDVIAERAATLAARVLKGEAPSLVAPVQEPSTSVVFDARQLKRWGIAERRLPAGSAVKFREPTLWSEYKWSIAGVTALVLAQGLLIGGLVAGRRQRQRVQASLEASEHRYRIVADFGADWDYWTLPDGSMGYVSPSCESVTGYDVASFLRQPESRHGHSRRRGSRRVATASRGGAQRVGPPDDGVPHPEAGRGDAVGRARVRASARSRRIGYGHAGLEPRRHAAEAGRGGPAPGAARNRGTARPPRGRQQLHARATAARGRHHGHPRRE